MKKFIKKGASLVGLVAAGAIGAAALAPTAQANTQGGLNDKSGWAYATELTFDGEYETAEQATSLAYTICGLRGQGYSEEYIRHTMEIKYSVSLSVDVVGGAEFHFCPGYDVNSSPELGPVGQPLWLSQGYGPSNPYGPPFAGSQYGEQWA